MSERILMIGLIGIGSGWTIAAIASEFVKLNNHTTSEKFRARRKALKSQGG